MREWARLAFGEWREGAPLAAPSTLRLLGNWQTLAPHSGLAYDKGVPHGHVSNDKRVPRGHVSNDKRVPYGHVSNDKRVPYGHVSNARRAYTRAKKAKSAWRAGLGGREWDAALAAALATVALEQEVRPRRLLNHGASLFLRRS
jgi:hypothetical protein